MQSAVETESKGKAEALRMKKKLESLILTAIWNTQMLLMPIHSVILRIISSLLGKLNPSFKNNKGQRKLLMMSLSMLSAGLILTRMLWRSQELFLSKLTVLAVWSSRSLLIPIKLVVNKLAPTKLSRDLSRSLNLRCQPFRYIKSMI